MRISMVCGRTLLNQKMRFAFRSIAIATMFCTIGCISWKNVSLVENTDGASRPREIDVVSRGTAYTIHAPVVAGDSVRGWADEKRTARTAFALTDIQQARVRQVDGARTGLLVAGGAAATLGIWALLIIGSGGISPSY